MKNLIFYLSILICLSCKKNNLKQVTNEPIVSLNENNEKKKNTEVLLKLPIGEKKLIEYNFPKEWNNLQEIDDANPDFSIEKTSKKGYDSIFYFIEKNTDDFFNSLNYNKKEVIDASKKEVEILLKLYDSSVVLDSVYYAGTISKTPNYIVKLYKNGDKYKSILGSGNGKSSFNYLCLATFNNEDVLIDSKIIYYNNYDDIQSYKRFFYIDENLKLYLKDFTVNELNTEIFCKTNIEITEKGFFNKK
ncbi:hypothetical protein SAMN05421857_1890 [Chryseobacterium formosense]|uniref:hypothetical protein n=1 Tax=Chryseobacterium formosense TaxID=236814 RepID=UPI0008DEBAF6|nr:hypothetical protein [Chryseobacterium formosense]SFT58942.1 hypothetical protein SAMN05421857_1890 [Chryseobacterium formosense]